MNCKDCIHYEACRDWIQDQAMISYIKDNVCDTFAEKSKFKEVVHCKDCIHCVPLDNNCEINTSAYHHCMLWRGDETKNVWHKYKKYYKDYSIVENDDYCSRGEK